MIKVGDYIKIVDYPESYLINKIGEVRAIYQGSKYCIEVFIEKEGVFPLASREVIKLKRNPNSKILIK